ncbi:hypothetical protein JOC75_000692 [Metabacillus crassostreae]|uniref:hypothetical protein n=1 Tax=Metabacillus crassostreae TaxID=929098 RepID=UPI00195B739F|nr:hypothetical protein [Metabacillus crassostreae]MBM7602722.1 hypothetical protein [Metabacillus crassostreae]
MRVIMLILGLFIVSSLTGCFGEDYDFSPPTVTVMNGQDETIELAEANIDWYHDSKYNKETENIYSFAKEQDTLYLKAGDEASYSLENGHFNPSGKGISISVWKNDQKTELELKDVQTFSLPKEIGDYTLVLDLNTDKGNAQYVGNISIQ